MKSHMTHQFSQVPRAEIPRSVFTRSSSHKTTFDSGYLVPFFVDEVLPGDTFNLRSNIFARLATPIAPFMDNLIMDTFYFFVPNRLIWENWERFCGAQSNPGDSTDFLVPTLTSPGHDYLQVSVGELGDYFGLPTGVQLKDINALPFRAYNLIWNEWFRDQNLQDSLGVQTTDGPDSYSEYDLQRRGKRHDYFTSCLPWPQKGPGVELPLGATAPVQLASGMINAATGQYVGSAKQMYHSPAPVGVAVETMEMVDYNSGGNYTGIMSTNSDRVKARLFNPNGTLVADLSNATAATINSLREAFQLQRFFERDARGGTRYTEILRAHFGVVSPDARLQRPEYLGGSSSPVVINPVQQTSSTDTTSPQGNLAAFGVVGSRSNGFAKSFVEHGYIIGLVSVRADLTYQQGINRMWSRQTRYDFYWPAFSHLGEQAVLNKEIYAQGNPSVDDAIFGYQERHAEYRYKPSIITGKFRSTYAQSLDVWHLAQKFDSLPTLSAAFIEDNPPVDRVIAVQDEPHFLMDSYIELKCTRPMPLYGVPGMIDHF